MTLPSEVKCRLAASGIEMIKKEWVVISSLSLPVTHVKSGQKRSVKLDASQELKSVCIPWADLL